VYHMDYGSCRTEPIRLDSNLVHIGDRANAAHFLWRTALPQKGKHLRIRTVSISRTRQLATRANVLAGPA
jgi:hypothetical protein